LATVDETGTGHDDTRRGCARREGDERTTRRRRWREEGENGHDKTGRGCPKTAAECQLKKKKKKNRKTPTQPAGEMTRDQRRHPRPRRGLVILWNPVRRSMWAGNRGNEKTYLERGRGGQEERGQRDRRRPQRNLKLRFKIQYLPYIDDATYRR
jgi:hypothetical protein